MNRLFLTTALPIFFALQVFANSVTLPCEFESQLICEPSSSPSNPSMRSEGLKVLFWNLAQGGVDIYKDSGISPLNNNIKTLNQNVDVYIFSEYSVKALKKSTVSTVSQTHPHTRFYKYNGSARSGISIWSRHPINDIQVSYLDIVPENTNSISAEEFRKKWSSRITSNKSLLRPLIHISVKKNNRVHHLITSHLINPWMSILKLNKQAGNLLAKVLLAREMAFAKERNPLYNQLNLLANYTELAANSTDSPLLLLGDMNYPRVLPVLSDTLGFSVRSMGYYRLQQKLEDAFTEHSPTIPTVAKSEIAKLKYPPQKVDHAFTNRSSNIDKASVLPLAGSDHYPLLIEMR